MVHRPVAGCVSATGPGFVAQPFGRLFRDHQGGRIGVAAGDGGHGARIHHAQARDRAAPAVPHAQPRVEHRGGIPVGAHARGAHGVEDGGGDVSRQARELLVGLVLRARLPFLGPVGRQCRLRHDAARDTQRIGGHLPVLRRAQVARRDRRRVLEAGAADAHRAAARGIEVAHAGGERRERVQRLPERIERQGLHVVLDIGVRLPGRAAGEGPQLRRRHAHRAGALQGVLEPDARAAPQVARQRVERGHPVHLEDRADLQVVLQVAAHPRQVVRHGDAVRLQQLSRADARELQQLRRIDGTRAQDHVAGGMRGDHLAAVPHLHARAAAGAVRQALQQKPRGLRAGPHLEIGPAVAGGPQEGLGGVPAPAVLLVDLEIAHALVGAAVEVVGGRNAGLLRGARESVQHVPAQALALHPPFTAAAGGLAAVQLPECLARGVGAVQAPVVLVAAEGRQHGFPAPCIVAGDLRPLLVVPCLPAHVDHAVDAAAAAQGLAARVAQAAAVQPLVRFGLVEPVGARVADAVEVAHGNVDPVVIVLAAGFHEQHAVPRIGAQPVAQQGAGRTAADDDEVERGVAHGRRGRRRALRGRTGGRPGPLCAARPGCR